jgi:DNA ligase-1
MKNTFPCLYKQTTTGKIQQWSVSVEGNVITAVYGQHGGKLQTVSDVVKSGKNIGKSNETTAEEQAYLEAQQTFNKKVKEGYNEDIDKVRNNKNILDAIEPMLAYPVEDKIQHLVFPGLAQPKLDGIRCIAIKKGEDVKLFSRTQKEFLPFPHIVEDIKKTFKDDVIIDGELYNHKYKNNFNYIVSLVRRDDLHTDYRLIEYHMYDVVRKGGYLERTKKLVSEGSLHRVATVEVCSLDALKEYQLRCIEEGYEGCMYRNPSTEYEHRRSTGLLKVKTFKEEEFMVVGIEEGRGKLMGKVGAFICANTPPHDDTFGAKPSCTEEMSKFYWDNQKQFIGKMASVKFQDRTPDGIPRFPILKTFRDYE